MVGRDDQVPLWWDGRYLKVPVAGPTAGPVAGSLTWALTAGPVGHG